METAIFLALAPGLVAGEASPSAFAAAGLAAAASCEGEALSAGGAPEQSSEYLMFSFLGGALFYPYEVNFLFCLTVSLLQ